MKSSLVFLLCAVGALAATPVKRSPSLVERDLATITSVVADITVQVDALDAAAKSFTGDGTALEAAAAAILSAINSGNTAIAATDDLSEGDALSLATVISNFATDVNNTVNDVIAIHDALVTACLGPTVYQTFVDQQAASNTLATTITSKVPAELQSIAAELAATITDALQDGVDAFNGAAGCTSSTTSSASSTSTTDTGSSSTDTGSSSDSSSASSTDSGSGTSSVYATSTAEASSAPYSYAYGGYPTSTAAATYASSTEAGYPASSEAAAASSYGAGYPVSSAPYSSVQAESPTGCASGAAPSYSTGAAAGASYSSVAGVGGASYSVGPSSGFGSTYHAASPSAAIYTGAAGRSSFGAAVAVVAVVAAAL